MKLCYVIMAYSDFTFKWMSLFIRNTFKQNRKRKKELTNSLKTPNDTIRTYYEIEEHIIFD
jgi:hypothetical protein